MTVEKYLLDTNIAIEAIRRPSRILQDRFNSESAYLATCTVVAYELYVGAAKSQRSADTERVVDQFLAQMPVLDFDLASARHAGEIRSDLERTGKPIGGYDVLIAAIARSRGLIVVTANTREFERVAGLRVENWV